MSSDAESAQLKMDPESLFREDVYTDRRMGTIRVLSPVTRDGAPDPGRPVLYLGEAQLVTSVGALRKSTKKSMWRRCMAGHP